MNDPPAEITISLTYADAAAAIGWLCDALGFTKRLVVPGPDGSVMHSELSFGSSVLMVSSPKTEQGRVAPRGTETTHAVAVFVSDPEAHCERTRAAGAEILQEPKDEDFGARGYMLRDPGGHVWYFGDYRPGVHWS